MLLKQAGSLELGEGGTTKQDILECMKRTTDTTARTTGYIVVNTLLLWCHVVARQLRHSGHGVNYLPIKELYPPRR